MPVRIPTIDEPIQYVSQKSEDQSGATSEADIDRSFERDISYDRNSLLLEEEKETVEEPIQPTEPELTQEELDHIAMISKMAQQASIEESVQPVVEEFEDQYDATSEVDIENYFTGTTSDVKMAKREVSKVKDDEEIDIDAAFDGDTVSQQKLTKEELNHINMIQRMAEQSSMEQFIPTIKPIVSQVPIRIPLLDNVEVESVTTSEPEVKKEIRRTSISYTSRISSQSLRDLRSSMSFPSTSITEENPAKRTLLRESSVQIVNTDHVLRDLQNLEHSEPQSVVLNEPEEDILVQDIIEFEIETSSMVNKYVIEQANFQQICNPMPSSPIRRTMSATHADGGVFASLQNEVKHAQSHDQIKSSRPNAYELCEQHSFRDAQPLLCNVDFLWRLNFAANRMTEEIAEEAGRQLCAHYRNVANPRARYFSDTYIDTGSDDEEQESPIGFVVEPFEETPSYGLFSFFSSKKKSIADRPRSALAMFTTTSPSPSMMRKESEDRGDILNLLRRSSGADSRASNDSSKLPDHALVGLSESEKQHIMSVMSRSNRSTSPMASRRCSSALQMLPEVGNISDAEREHIQNVLEKAEMKTPFMIKIPIRKQISSRTESTNSRVSSDGIDEEVAQDIAIDEQQLRHEPIIEVPSRATTPRNNLRVVPPPIAILCPTPPHSAKSDSSKMSSGSSASNTQQFGFSTPSISGFKTFFDKAKETLIKEDAASKQEELSAEELEHIRRVSMMADEMNEEVAQCATPVQKKNSGFGLISLFGKATDVVKNVLLEDENALTQEELDHIARMNALAEQELGSTTSNKESELTQEELDHIARMAKMAEEDSFMTGFVSQEPVKQELTQNELDHIARMAAMAEEDTQFTENWKRQDSDEASSKTGSAEEPDSFDQDELNYIPEPVIPLEPELTQEELDHITKMAAMAEQDTMMTGLASRSKPTEPELTQEELDHIARMAAMAEEDSMMTGFVPESSKLELTQRISQERLSKPSEPELTQEELDHIARMTAMAEEDMMTTGFVSRPSVVKPMEPELTQEELDHIARMTRMAEEDSIMTGFLPQPVVKPAEPELTQEELEHIERMARMAEEDSMRTGMVPQQVVVKSVEPELTQEEIEHIERMTRMAEEDSMVTGFAPQPSVVKPVEPELTQEELDHIAMMARMAEEDSMMTGFASQLPVMKPSEPEFTQEELDHIARMAAMAEEDSMMIGFASHPHVMKSAEPELTQEELDHIAMMTKMAEEDSMMIGFMSQKLVVQSSEPELTQEELDHIARMASMAEQDAMLTGFAPQQPLPVKSAEPELSHEEFDHISRRAVQDTGFFPQRTADQEPEEDENWQDSENSSRTGSAEEPDDIDEDVEETPILQEGTSSVEKIDEKKEECAYDNKRSKEEEEEEEDEKDLTASPSGGSMNSRKSSEFDIRSISEIKNESEDDIGKWYGEQLSFMRQSIEHNEDIIETIDQDEYSQEYVEEQLDHGGNIPREETEKMETLKETESMGSNEHNNYYYSVEEEKEYASSSKSSIDASGVEKVDDEEEAKKLENKEGEGEEEVIGGGRMLKKRTNFGGFFTNFANDAISKAKEAGGQIQAAVAASEVSKPSTSSVNTNHGASINHKNINEMPAGFEGLSDAERQKIMSVMADADMEAARSVGPSRSQQSSSIPPGMEGLSEVERQKIMAVMAEAEMDTVRSAVPSRSPSVNRLQPPQSTMSAIPPGLEGLSEAERQKIMSVMADAEMDAARSAVPSRVPSRSPSASRFQPPLPQSMPIIPPGLEGLSEAERAKIMSVMADAEQDTARSAVPSRVPSRSPSATRFQPPSPQSMPTIPPGFEGLSEAERQKIMSVMADAEMDNVKSAVPSRSPSATRFQLPPPQNMPIIPPGLEGLSEAERAKIMSVMADAEIDTTIPSRSPSATRFQPPSQSMSIIPPGLEGLSEEERQKIMSVMADAEMDTARSAVPSRSPSATRLQPLPPQSMPTIPPGLEGLSEEERQKIMSVMADAEMDTVRSAVPSRSPSATRLQPLPPHSMSTIPSGLEGLSEEERQKIMSVMADAEMDTARSAVPSRSPSTILFQPPQTLPTIPPGLEGLSDAERQKIMSVMADAEMDNVRSAVPSRSPSATRLQQPMIPPGLEDLSEDERLKIMSVMANAEVEEARSRPQSALSEYDLPKPINPFMTEPEVEPQFSGFTMEDLERSQERDRPTGHSGFKPAGYMIEETPISSSSKRQLSYDSTTTPTRESGYATSSTSYEKELGGERDLEDLMKIREGACSRRDSREGVREADREYNDDDDSVHTPEPLGEEAASSQKDDFDFTYSDTRFAEIVKLQEEEEAAAQLQKHQQEQLEKSRAKGEEKPRMWTTVFEGDESELPIQEFVDMKNRKTVDDFDFPKETDEVFEKPAEMKRIRVTKTHDVDMDEIYDNVITTSAIPTSSSKPMKEVEFDSSSKPKTLSKLPPQIKITAEEEQRSDSEDEEENSEDDDEYPDHVVAAPSAPTPTFEEVEKERMRQEELASEVLMQIQAFGEVANDEFDVKWAKSSLTQQQKQQLPRSQPIPIPISQKKLEESEQEKEKRKNDILDDPNLHYHGHNPFLDSPEEDDDVSVNMEDVEFAEIAKFYETANQMMRRPGPVYTIAEDESEDDGTLSNSESRMNAREKRLMSKERAESLMQKYERKKNVEIKKTVTTASSIPSNSTYAIISFAGSTKPTTTDSSVFFEKLKNQSKEPKKDIPPEISASIDRTMAEVESLLGQVYTSDKSKPNLLCFDQSRFEIPKSTKSTETDMNESVSPSFLLPLKQSAVLGSGLESVKNESIDDDTSPRGLKRSPGMLLPSPTSTSAPIQIPSSENTIGASTSSMFGGINIVDSLPSTLDGLTNSYKWLQNIEDDGSAGCNEMGRRKLPSIPPNSSAFPPPPPLHQQLPPSTSTSSRGVVVDATLPMDPIVPRSIVAPVYITSSSAPIESRPTSSLSMYQNDVILSRPTSAASNYTTASAINPTILPGVAYPSKAPLRQPLSSVIAPRTISSSVKTSLPTTSARVPNTLARVLLKKELKEVLNQRKNRLEATEIEANQRHYKVQKMLVTGLLPEKPEDDIPRVVKCSLPPDLVKDVHIAPIIPPSPAARRGYPSPPSVIRRTTISPKRYEGQRYEVKADLNKKSIATQANSVIDPHPTTSLRAQMDFERRPALMTYVGKRSAETQTENGYGSLPRQQSTRRRREHHSSSSSLHQSTSTSMPHNDLLEITRRYFEDYDRQLKDIGTRHSISTRKRFNFHDDDDQNDLRKAQVMSELARRKERMCASCEILNTATDMPMTSDYSSHVPHYGSLPRIDYPRGPRSDLRDFTYRQQNLPMQNYAYNCGSLPRNFERTPYQPIEIEHEQSFGAPPPSTSMYDLAYTSGVDEYIPKQNNMISQYASYLNKQFMSQNQQSLNYAAPPMMSTQLPHPMQPITRYDDPLLIPRARINPNPLAMSSYSRNDMNYGSRPAQSSLLEYGNTRHYDMPVQQQQQQQQPLMSTSWAQAQQAQSQAQGSSYLADPQSLVVNRWPKDDALSRMYATVSRRPREITNPNNISTGSSNYARRAIRPVSYRNPHASNSMPSDRRITRRHVDGKYDVKRILLTRRYKHHNVYNDLGVRIVGGKRQNNGELAAYVSAVNNTLSSQTLGQIKIGDEVVEWNGVLLRGKTFEEVERIVNSSQGEVEMLIRTEKAPMECQSLNRRREDMSPVGERVPPVPMHRINGVNNNNNGYHSHTLATNYHNNNNTLSDSSHGGHIQVSLAYDGNSRLVAKIQRARGLRSRDPARNAPNPFVKVYLLPGRKVSHKRRTRFVDSSCSPEWNQILEYQVAPHTLNTMFLEFTVCDYQRDIDDLPLGSVQIPLTDKSAINSGPRWYPLQHVDQRNAPAPSSNHMSSGGNYAEMPLATPRAPITRQMHQHHHQSYQQQGSSILAPSSKSGRHATFNYNPVSLDIGYPAIN